MSNNEEGIMGFRVALLVALGVGLFLPLISAATDPSGVVSNVILGQGVPVKEIDEHVKSGDTWLVKSETKGPSDVFYQDLVVGPGGRTGWHSHPGLLMITVKEGTVDWLSQPPGRSGLAPMTLSKARMCGYPIASTAWA